MRHAMVVAAYGLVAGGSMARRCLGAAGSGAALLLIVVYTAAPAAAQNTINQTTCGGLSGVGNCLTNGFLQDLTVDCANAHGTEVDTALAQITDRNGPNRITLSGGNCGGFRIVGFNRLTIVGDGSALGGFWGFIDSHNILLKSMTFDFSVQFGFVNIQGSEVTFDGVTVKNARDVSGIGPDSAVDLARSSLGFTGAPSLITNNPCIGISVGVGSRLNVANVTVSNNGSGRSCENNGSGIRVRDGGSVILANQIRVNGTFVDAPVDISGNGDGLEVDGGSLEAHTKTGNAMIRIHDNLGPGLGLLGASTAGIDGHIQFDGNNLNGQPPVQVFAAINAGLFIGGGVQVQGGLQAIDALVNIGKGGPMTISGGVFLNFNSVGAIEGSNSIDTMTCDGTSYAYNPGNIPTSGPNTCPSDGPRPRGIAGLEVVSKVEFVTIREANSVQVLASCPANKLAIGAGYQLGNLHYVVRVSRPNAATTVAGAPRGWVLQVYNTATTRQTGPITLDVLCASAP